MAKVNFSSFQPVTLVHNPPTKRHYTSRAARWQSQKSEISRWFPHLRQRIWKIASNRMRQTFAHLQRFPPETLTAMTPFKLFHGKEGEAENSRNTAAFLFLVNERLVTSVQALQAIPTINRPHRTRRSLAIFIRRRRHH